MPIRVKGARHNLSPRQYDMLMLFAQAHTYRDIADVFDVSYHTVKNTLHTARRKLGTHTTFQAVKVFKERMYR